MNLAVNYSEAVADLLEKGQIAIDRVKCPAWPDLIATVRDIHPTYIHFPLTAGQGIGNAFDMETHGVANWSTIEGLLTQTNTPFVNIHLAATVHEHTDFPADTEEPEHVERLLTCLIRDVRAVVEQFGPERVIVENDHDAIDFRHGVCGSFVLLLGRAPGFADLGLLVNYGLPFGSTTLQVRVYKSDASGDRLYGTAVVDDLDPRWTAWSLQSLWDNLTPAEGTGSAPTPPAPGQYRIEVIEGDGVECTI
jgi:hypothetical protein